MGIGDIKESLYSFVVAGSKNPYGNCCGTVTLIFRSPSVAEGKASFLFYFVWSHPGYLPQPSLISYFPFICFPVFLFPQCLPLPIAEGSQKRESRVQHREHQAYP